MGKKIERVLEELEYLKGKEIELRKRVGKESNNSVVSFGKILAFEDAIRFIESEYS
tara:strand:+ start:413 stop:580 length:168 start_codon:yes stop_codon:yes gene_type:complete